MRFYYERVEGNRNFANKLWNATKFTLMNLDDYDKDFVPSKDQLTLADKWILDRLAYTEDYVSNTLTNSNWVKLLTAFTISHGTISATGTLKLQKPVSMANTMMTEKSRSMSLFIH